MTSAVDAAQGVAIHVDADLEGGLLAVSKLTLQQLAGRIKPASHRPLIQLVLEQIALNPGNFCGQSQVEHTLFNVLTMRISAIFRAPIYL